MNAEDFVQMLNIGWPLTDIAQMAGIDVREVEQAIILHLRQERLLASAA